MRFDSRKFSLLVCLGLLSLTTACAQAQKVVNQPIDKESRNYKLSGKTGGVGNLNGKAFGWFVGYVETKDNTYFFALNMDGENYAAIRDKRIDLTKQILSELGFMKK